MIAVHGGAGMQANDEHKICAKILRTCNGDIVSAITSLEKNVLFNCGHGSNLTVSGRVECEAAYMTSRGLAFGAVGAVTNCITPSVAARALTMTYEKKANSWALVPPICLVGKGADQFCRERVNQEAIVDNEQLQSAEAKRHFQKASKIMRQNRNGRLDTVGGVAINPDGTSESCASSGGLILKRDGRLGHCTQFGAGVWSEQRDGVSVAVSLSGCGEALLRTRLAERLAERCFKSVQDAKYDLDDSPMMGHFHDLLIKDFVESPRLSAFPKDRRLVGGLLMMSGVDGTELFVFHNTPHFGFAYSSDGGASIKRQRSTRVDSCTADDIVFHSFIL